VAARRRELRKPDGPFTISSGRPARTGDCRVAVTSELFQEAFGTPDVTVSGAESRKRSHTFVEHALLKNGHTVSIWAFQQIAPLGSRGRTTPPPHGQEHFQ
jgi:hypothetical protein